MHAAITAARAEGRDNMGRITDKDHPVMDEAVDAAAIEGVDRYPVQLEGPSANDLFDPRDHVFRLFLLLRVGVGAQLQIDAVDIVRLLVKQRRLAGMEGRREPEPALGRKVRLHLDIGDEKAFLEMPTLEVKPELPAYAAVGPVTGQHIVTAQGVGTVRCLDLGGNAGRILRHRQHPVLEPQVDQVREVGAAFNQILLDIILLQIDEGREFVPILGKEVEIIDLAVAAIDAAKLPGDTLFQHPLANAEPVEDLEASFGPADGAAANRHDIVVIDDDAGDAMRCQVNGRRQPDGASADNDHRCRCSGPAGKFGRRYIVKGLKLISCHGQSILWAASRSAARSTSPCHAGRSRSAACRFPWPRQRPAQH